MKNIQSNILMVVLALVVFCGVSASSCYYNDNQIEPEDEVGRETVPVPPSLSEVPKELTLRDPSWEVLKVFLWQDQTDQLEYVFPVFVCEDFAKRLQVNAKEAGWRCAIVVVSLAGYPDWHNYGISANTEHSLNAFVTTNRGLVYIDCTSSPELNCNADKIVNIDTGASYKQTSIFPSLEWGEWLSMGIVTGIVSITW